MSLLNNGNGDNRYKSKSQELYRISPERNLKKNRQKIFRGSKTLGGKTKKTACPE